jgi:hypothetical protein
MKYAIEMNSDAMMYISSFMKTGSAIQKLVGRDAQTYRQHEERIGPLSFFKMRKEGLK